MRKLLLSLVCGVSAMVAQSTNYPTALDTNSTLFVTSDNVQTVLTNPVLVGDTALVVQSNTGFAANQIATVCDTINTSNVCTAWEHMLVTSVSGGNVIFVTRGFAGTVAAPHQAGKTVAVLIDSAHQSALKQAVIAIETLLGPAMNNVPGSPSGAAVPIAKGGTGATTQGGALSAILGGVPLPAANGGTGVTAVQGNGAKAQLSTGATTTNDCVKYDANGNTVDSGGPCNALPNSTAQLQYLRTTPNSGNNTTYGFAAIAPVSTADYNYPAQTPGGALSSGVAATVTLTPCPLGVGGTDQRLRFYISGGSGSAESVASTGGGSCSSGAATGTVTFTPANSHSGAWTIQSSLAGIYEAVIANPGREVIIPGGTYTMRDCINLPTGATTIITGQGSSISGVLSGSALDFSGVSGCSAGFILSQADPVNIPVQSHLFRDFYMKGAGTSGTTVDGFNLTNVAAITLSNVSVEYFHFGVTGSNVVTFIGDRNFQVNFSAGNGIQMSGFANRFELHDAALSGNSRLNGYANLTMLTTATNVVILNNVDINGAGTLPFTVVTSALGAYFQNISSLSITNCYFEANVGPQEILYQAGITSLVETGNWFNGMPILYGGGTTAVQSYSNTFYGAGVVRSFPSGTWSGWVVGPDTCLNGSTECTAHPHWLGHVSNLVTTGTFTAFVAPNYIATESGANNAIAGALLDANGTVVALAAGLRVQIKLAHTLQAGANTFVFNGTSKNITSHRSTGNIAAAYAVGAVVELLYDGTQWEDVSQ